jgi:hypothetical protein
MADLSQRVFSGPRAKIQINNVDIGHATDLSMTINSTILPVEEVGMIEASALLEVGRSCTITARYVKLYESTEDMVAAGIVPGWNTNDIVQWPEVNIVIQDRIGDNVIATVVGCRCTSRNMTVGARSVAMVDSQWVGRIFKEGSEA